MELTAENFLGLEDYLLARSALLDDGGSGVEFFDVSTGLLEPVRRANGVEVGVRGALRGITPGGHPVRLSPEEVLTAVLPGPAGATVWFEAAIEVNPPPAEPGPEAKLRLVLYPMAEAKTLPRAVVWNQLALGCYSWSGGRPLLVRYPPVRRLDAVRPLDKDWQSWVKELADRLMTLVKGARKQAPSQDALPAAMTAEAARLAFEWPALPVGKLAGRLRFLGWLRQGSEKWQPFGGVGASDGIPPEVAGHGLPGWLAQLYDQHLNRSPFDSGRLNVAFSWPEKEPDCLAIEFPADEFPNGAPAHPVELRLPPQGKTPPELLLTDPGGGLNDPLKPVDSGRWVYRLPSLGGWRIVWVKPLRRPAAGQPELWTTGPE
jgi:hypothetical protein